MDIYDREDTLGFALGYKRRSLHQRSYLRDKYTKYYKHSKAHVKIQSLTFEFLLQTLERVVTVDFIFSVCELTLVYSPFLRGIESHHLKPSCEREPNPLFCQL